MNNKVIISVLGVGALVIPLLANADYRPIGFFVTSVGMGNGGDLGGLEGADAYCKKLAATVGAGNREWRAYLSTEAPKKRGVFARQRIGCVPPVRSCGGSIMKLVTVAGKDQPIPRMLLPCQNEQTHDGLNAPAREDDHLPSRLSASVLENGGLAGTSRSRSAPSSRLNQSRTSA